MYEKQERMNTGRAFPGVLKYVWSMVNMKDNDKTMVVVELEKVRLWGIWDWRPQAQSPDSVKSRSEHAWRTEYDKTDWNTGIKHYTFSKWWWFLESGKRNFGTSNLGRDCWYCKFHGFIVFFQ